MSDNVVRMPESAAGREALRRALHEGRTRADRNALCGRHGCGHVGAEHLHPAEGPRRPDPEWGACKQCWCVAWVPEGCPPDAMVVVTAKSGVCYERCRSCGATRALAPGVDAAQVAWVLPDELAVDGGAGEAVP